ncbi:thioredoxin-like protein, partial [Coniochaeta sp. 2T2.1]
MRFSPFALLFGAATIAAAASAEDAETQENTYFNGKKVPPMLELTESNWEKEINASKWLLVKHYSPWCHHCQAYAPTYQTLYEYYYTSTPEGSGNENADFTKFYDFRFASINCVVWADLCEKNGVTAFPQTILFKDGKQEGEVMKGVKDLPTVSKVVEDALEKTKPGTRPRSIDLPKPGDTESVAYKEAHTLSNQKDGKVKADPSLKAKAAAPTKTPAVNNAINKSAAKKPKKPTATPNPEGKSVVLNADNFQTKVTMTQDPWFIKFYAPWCHHCQAMAPNWEQLAKEMKGKLNVGEVNCDANARLCKDAKLRGYPTILFFKGGERVEYEGLRGLGDFVQYAEKAIDIAGGVQDVDAVSLKELEEKEEVIFIYFYDAATASEDFLALERLPMSLIGRAKLVKTQDEELSKRFKITTWPRLLVAREGRPTYYAPLTPREMRDTHQVLRWMRSVWLPIVPELTASNAREIMDGKIVVLGILNREDQDHFMQSKREMKSAANEWMDKQIQLFQLERQELRDAKQLRIEEAEDRNDQRALRAAKAIRINMDKSDHKEVVFAWCDGVFWQRWVRTTYGIDVKDGERVIINDEDNRRYWDQTITGNYIIPSRTSILETLNKITASPPKIKPKLTISSFEKIFFDIRMTFTEHPFLSTGCILGIGLGLASWFRGRLRRTRGGHFRIGEDLGREFKAPLLGSNSNGKV